MTYDLYIADRTFSSWSLRGWLMFAKFGIPVRTHVLGLYSGTFAEDMAPLAPARLVPVIRKPEGQVIGETLAIAETLAERHPDAGLWPEDAGARAHARWLVSEMHAGFGALRGECPMQLIGQYRGFEVSTAVGADLARLEELWASAAPYRTAGSPWLFGRYSLADVFYAPVAARIAGYRLPVGPEAGAYVKAHLGDEKFRQWRAMGLTKSYDPVPYAMDLEQAEWPGPAPLAARAVEEGPALNDTCPYSGKPVTHYLDLGGETYGFCNAFCRDKTVADPEAWPLFVRMRRDLTGD